MLSGEMVIMRGVSSFDQEIVIASDSKEGSEFCIANREITGGRRGTDEKKERIRSTWGYTPFTADQLTRAPRCQSPRPSDMLQGANDVKPARFSLVYPRVMAVSWR